MSEQYVTVVNRTHRVRATGLRRDGVVAYDWGLPEHDPTRSFVLLDDGIQIGRKAWFPPTHRDWWYCDLMGVVDEGATLHVSDLWIDVLVGPPDRPYHVIDLEEFGEAMVAGLLSVADAADGLARLQRFLDRRLNRRYDLSRPWPDFPPAAVEALTAAELPQDWAPLG